MLHYKCSGDRLDVDICTFILNIASDIFWQWALTQSGDLGSILDHKYVLVS